MIVRSVNKPDNKGWMVMAKFGPPKAKGAFANPAAPKRMLNAEEAESALTTPVPHEVTTDSDESEQSEQDIIDEVFGTENGEEEEEGDEGEESEEPDDEEGDDERLEDKPTKPAAVAAKGTTKKQGGNLSAEQQKYWDEIVAVGHRSG